MADFHKYTKTIEIHIDPVTSAITVHPAKGDPDLMDLMLSAKAMIDIGEDQMPGFKEQVVKFETKEQLEKFLSQEKWITYRSAINFKDYHLCLKHKNLALGKVSINTKEDNSNVSNS